MLPGSSSFFQLLDLFITAYKIIKKVSILLFFFYTPLEAFKTSVSSLQTVTTATPGFSKVVRVSDKNSFPSLHRRQSESLERNIYPWSLGLMKNATICLSRHKHRDTEKERETVREREREHREGSNEEKWEGWCTMRVCPKLFLRWLQRVLSPPDFSSHSPFSSSCSHLLSIWVRDGYKFMIWDWIRVTTFSTFFTLIYPRFLIVMINGFRHRIVSNPHSWLQFHSPWFVIVILALSLRLLLGSQFSCLSPFSFPSFLSPSSLFSARWSVGFIWTHCKVCVSKKCVNIYVWIFHHWY